MSFFPDISVIIRLRLRRQALKIDSASLILHPLGASFASPYSWLWYWHCAWHMTRT